MGEDTKKLCIVCVGSDDWQAMNVSTCDQCGNIGLVMEVDNVEIDNKS